MHFSQNILWRVWLQDPLKVNALKRKMKKRKISIINLIIVFILILGLTLGGCSCNNEEKDDDPTVVVQTTKMSTKYVNRYFSEQDLYHDQAYKYMEPLEPSSSDSITLRLKCLYGSCRSAKIWYTEDSGANCSFTSIDMKFEISDVNCRYEYWVGTIPASSSTKRYHFSLINDKETIYYNFNGISEEQITGSNGEWIIMPDFSTPDWSKGTVWYSAMPDSFYNGNVLNDKTGGTFSDAWGNYHTSMNGYFGGDYAGLEEKIDYIKELGADSLFINPIWLTTHNAGYGSFDFMQSDSAYGSNEMLKALTDALHDENMQIMLDGVFEYINVNNILYNQALTYPYLDGGISEGDTYYDFVQRDSNGNVIYSTWGSPLINFSSEVVREYIYKNIDSIMQYYIREIGIDGWRMDVGNDLSGSDENNFGTSSQILKDMRQYIKDANEEVLFLSEHANGDQFDYILDSKWNYSFGYAIRDWAAGLSNPSVLMSTIESGVLGLPRSVANSSYNFLTTHDLTRIIDIIDYDGGDKTSTFNAANLLMFTFVGSPCIYYGEEVGMEGQNVIENTTASPFFNSMEWDETDVNYEIYNMTKALGALRKEYPSDFKDGAYLNVYSETSAENNPSGIISFARFDESGSVISAVNATNSIVKNFTLDIGKVDIRDGSTLTDYLTGRTYKVKDGKITVDIYPGGSIFVTGEANKDVVFGKNKCSIGDANYSVSANDNGFTLSGSGTISGSSDSFGFVYEKAFGNANVSITLDSGEYSLVIRDGLNADDAEYGIKITGTKVRAFARVSNGAKVSYFTTREFDSGSVITVKRKNDNVFCYVVDGKEYDIATIDADYYTYAGIAITANSSIPGFDVVQADQQKGTLFGNNIGSFTYAVGEYTVNNGLTLYGSNNRHALIVAPIGMSDFTVKTDFKSVPTSGYAGIAIGYTGDYIFLGRYNGKIIAAHITGGDIAIYGSVADETGDVVFQIEKVGATYRAIIIDDDGYTEVVDNMYANYSKVDAMLVANNCDAEFGYLSFGDYIDGKNGFASFKKQGNISFALTESNSDYGYRIFGGAWEYVTGGIKQTDISAETSQYVYSTNQVTDFNATFTIKAEFKDNSSYVQAIWGKSSADSLQGYSMKLTSSGKVQLVDRSSTVISEYQIENFTCGNAYHFTITVKDNNAFVYLGEERKLILSGTYMGGKGYFGWNGACSIYTISSYGVYSADGNYKLLSGTVNTYDNNMVAGGIDLELSGGDSNYGYLTMEDTVVSNFVMSFNMMLSRTSLISRGRFRVYIGGKSGYNSLNNGLILQLDDKGRVTIYENGVKKIDNQEVGSIDTESCYMVIAYVDGQLTLYKADYREDLTYAKKYITKIFSFTDSFCRSGALSFFTQNATVRMCNIRGLHLSDGDDYTKSVLFTDFFIDAPPAPEPEIISAPATVGYSNDFSDKQTLGDFTRYSGAVSVQDGVLIVDGIKGQNWDAGAGLAYGTFKDFELTVKVKIQNAYGWGAIEFNKSSPSVNHQQGAITLLLTQSGASLYLGNDVTQENSSVGIGTADENGFITVSIRVKDGNLTYSFGAESKTFVISDLSRNNLYSGFISFNAGSNRVYFDDLTINLL